MSGDVLAGLYGRSLTRDADLSKEEFLALVAFAQRLRDEKRDGVEVRRLVGKNVALIFEKTSTRTRAAFEIATHDQGAHVSYLGPGETQLGHKESIKDTARVLGRLYDGIEFRGFAQTDVETLRDWAGVPVWNGLTDAWHPTQLLADVMTIIEHTDRPLEEVVWCYLGDARNNTANSLLVTGARLGLDVRVVAPPSLQPSSEVREHALAFARASGARVTISDDLAASVRGADFLYTDVWVSMGEPPEKWAERIDLLLGYQVNATTLKLTENERIKVMHCLPALHDVQSGLGKQLLAAHHLEALEITDDVFESPASIVFDQAENRLHTIKALMVATLRGR